MMKGKDKFTSAEILELRELIAERQNASRNYQKQLRNRMRKIGFFGRDDWGIIDCTLEDLDELIDTERIKIIDKMTSTIITDKSKSKNAIIIIRKYLQQEEYIWFCVLLWMNPFSWRKVVVDILKEQILM